MTILVCGAGRVGYNIVQYLSHTNHPLVVIDNNPQVIQKITDDLDVRAVLGEASHPDVLMKAGADKASIIIAATQIDEVNMVICQISQALFGIPNKIARIRNRAYLDNQYMHIFDQGHLSIDHIISPEAEVADAICDSLSVPGAFIVYYLCERRLKLAGMKCRNVSPIINTPISRIPNLFPQIQMTVLGISRGGNHMIPDDAQVLLENDEVYVCFPEEQTTTVMEAFGLIKRPSEKLIILGGGQIGFQLASRLETSHEDLKTTIVELNRERAIRLSQQLERTAIISGDALDSEVLEEAGITSADIVISLTEDDKVNSLSALVAKQYGVSRVLALINNKSYEGLMPTLGIDGVINPRSISVSKILQSIKHQGVRAVYSLRENLGEVLEIDVQEGGFFSGKSVEDISQQYEVKVGAILREGVYIPPTPKTMISLTDIIVLMVSKESTEAIKAQLQSQV